jgi:hypothetical protein
MVDRFQRRPNSRDREALERELSRGKRDRRGSRSLTRYFDRDTLRRVGERIDPLEAALDGELHVLRCDATDVIAFGDDEDDIDWYAFQVAPDRTFFLDDLTSCLGRLDDLTGAAV